jgi:hypothetical protein
MWGTARTPPMIPSKRVCWGPDAVVSSGCQRRGQISWPTFSVKQHLSSVTAKTKRKALPTCLPDDPPSSLKEGLHHGHHVCRFHAPCSLVYSR